MDDRMADDASKRADRDSRRAALRSLWRHRGRRLATGLNVTVSVLLALAAAGLVNYVSYHVHARVDLGDRGTYRLSDRSRALLSTLNAEVKVVVFFQRTHALYDEVRNVLREYESAAAGSRQLALRIEFVDPARDLSRVRELKLAYDLKEANVVVFECANRRRYVNAADILEYEYAMSGASITKRPSAFKAEQLFSSAIQSVTQSTWPVVYVLRGHGERDLQDGDGAGYSVIARLMRRDNIDVRPLLLTEPTGIPDDASAVIIAGPSQRLAEAELRLLRRYLESSGRALVLLDPGTETGLEQLLAGWGVRVGDGVAVGMTLTGRELVVAEYGDHAVTAPMKGRVVMFNTPRVIEPAGDVTGAVQADQPKVTVLAATTAEGWEEFTPDERPPRMDPSRDRPGPAGVAVAVERGTVSGLDMEIKPTRLIVAGDSYFIANAAMEAGAGGNVHFAMSALNWLVEREALMSIPPKVPWELHLDMSRDQFLVAFLVIVAGIPGVAALLGLAVWWKRRR